MSIALGEPPSARDRYLRIALYLAWLALVLFLVSRHAFWRDEVRALTIALSGDGIAAMLRNLQGEGHPAIWYLLLRGAHAIVPVREVLPAVSVLVSAAAMALLAFRSPFRTSVIAIIMFGAFALFEYTVVARNYGISMLALFAIAALYPRWRDRGVTIGLLLFLLCNTNVPAAWLAACILLFWLIELIGEEGLRWGPKYRLFIVNAAIAAAGALICFVTVYPPVHDAAPIEHQGGVTFGLIVEAIFFPALNFWALMPPIVPESDLTAALFGSLLFAALLGLLRSPGALLSSLAVLVGLELFYYFIYPSYYRHQALFLVWLIAMYWLVAKGRGGAWPSQWRFTRQLDRVAMAGSAVFVLLLFAQVVFSITIVSTEQQGYPFSRSRDLAAVLERERLGDAILVADPDIFLEPMPYYSGNPLYLMREQRFGNVVRFTRDVRQRLSLDDYLREAQQLQARFNRPVVFVFQHRFQDQRPYRTCEVHVWLFTTTPDQVRRFRGATRQIANFGPVTTDESFDAYVLNAGRSQPAVAVPPNPPPPTTQVKCSRKHGGREETPE